MTTLGTMLARIESEINRSDIDSNIYDAVISAIAFFEPQQFYFNQAVGTLTTTANQRYTTISSYITDFIYPLSLRVTDSSSQYRFLEPRPFTELEQKYLTDSSTGRLYNYAVFAERFYWWLIPDDIYTVTVNYIKSLTRPSSINDTSWTSAWMTDGEAMIRTKAKSYIYSDTLRNDAEAQKFEILSQNEKRNLLQKTEMRSYNSRIMGWC